MTKREKVAETVYNLIPGDKLEKPEKTPGSRNIEAVPHQPEPPYADTGHRLKKLPEGLIPRYIPKDDFGEVPVCIRKKRAAEKKAQQEYDRYTKEKMEQEALEKLQEAERQERLQGLKTTFKELLYEYQSMSLVIDTISKRQKRLWLEDQLNQLEKEIKLLEGHKVERREEPMESGYNLIPGGSLEKTPMYISKYREQVTQEKHQNKATHQTMGIAKVQISPDKYLLKHSKEPKLPEKKPFSYRDVQPRKPRIPAPTKQPPTDSQPQKDFIRYNAVKNIKAVPRKPEPAYADTRYGRTELLENSGLVPKYSKKKDFGDVPAYLRKKREASKKAQEEQYDRCKKEYEAMMKRSEDERRKKLQGLQTNFNELLNEYQSMSLVIDTISKRQKRLWLEKQLNQMEKDIKLIEKCKVIDISHD